MQLKRTKITNTDFEKVIITDCIPKQSNGKVKVVGLADLFAETIYRITHGASVSKLFE